MTFEQEDLPLTTISSLRANWDFSKVRAHLVASIAGKHEGWPDVLRTGHVALMKSVRDLGCAARPGQTLSVECQVCTIYADLLHFFYP
jgi:tyrosyl-DNA phosphodiesterase-1